MTVSTETLCALLWESRFWLSHLTGSGRAEEEELVAVRGMLNVEVLEVGIDETVVTRKEKRKTKEKERESEGEKDGTVEIEVRHI